MSEQELRARALDWISGLTDKQFSEFFYDAVLERRTSDTPEEQGHFVLADARRDSDSTGWDVDFVALPQKREPWADDVPICQTGECSSCGRVIRSWAKHQRCPICNEPADGS